MDTPPVGHVLETALYVDDLERSRAFYERVFGFETFFIDERMCAMRVPAQQVLLLFTKGGSVKPSATEGGTIPPHDGHGQLHLCFAIPEGSDGAWGTRLLGQGIPIESRVTWPRGAVSLYFRDPDGHSVEVATPRLWPHYTGQLSG